MLDVRPKRRFPFVGLDHEAIRRRVIARDFPCGLIRGAGAAAGFWMGFPSASRPGLDIVAGIRRADGTAAGMRFWTTKLGLPLETEILASLGHRMRDVEAGSGHFVDAVLAALVLRRAAADAGKLARQMYANGGWTVQLHTHFDAHLLAERLGRPPHEVDVTIGAMRGRVARKATEQVELKPRHAGRVLAAGSELRRLSTDVAEPFLSVVDEPALTFVQAEMAAGRSRVTLRMLDDAGWDALDDPLDGKGLRKALSTMPWHADMVMGAKPNPTGRWPSELPDVAAASGCIRKVPRSTTTRFAASRVGSAINKAHPTRFSSPPWVEHGTPWSSTFLDPHGVSTPLLPATAALSFLSCLPPEWCPSDEPGWAAFARLAPLLMEVRKIMGDHAPLRDFVNAGGDWAGYERRLAVATGPRIEAGTAMAQVHDVARAYGEQVVQPALCKAGPLRHGEPAPGGPMRRACIAVAKRHLWQGRSITRVLELSRRWHRDLHAMQVAVDALDPDLARTTRWERGLPDAVVDGVELSCLGSAADLRQEGARGKNPDGSDGLDHCVGSYVAKCLRGKSRILSLRRPGSAPVARLSTAEVSLSRLGRKVVQHHGRGNSNPPESCTQALDRYMAMLADGTLVAKPVRARWVSGKPPEVEQAGYDFRVPGRFETVRDLWSPYLPHPRKGWEPRRFADDVLEIARC